MTDLGIPEWYIRWWLNREQQRYADDIPRVP